MVKAKTIVALIYCTASHVLAIAQTAKADLPGRPYTALNIGDEVPDITFGEVLNYPVKKAKFSDFKAKLTILDFWSTSCSSCIALFPHMQSLEDEFKAELQIVLVNGKTNLFHDNETKIKNLLTKLQQRTGTSIHLPIVLNSETLDSYFPWETIPHEVWIDDKGRVVAITGAMEVTAENINALLEGKKIKMHTKKDVSFDLQQQTLPELIYGSDPSMGKPEYSSTLIKGYVDGLRGQGVRQADSPYTGLYTGWYITNQPLFWVYESAYRNVFKYPANQVIIEASNPSRFNPTTRNDSSVYLNAYSYDLSVSPTKFDELLTYVQGDLERTFKARVSAGTRRINCFVIRSTPRLRSSFSKGGEKDLETGMSASRKYFHNYPINEILKKLNTYSVIPMIDETGSSENLDMDLPDDLWNTDLLVQMLRKAGFDISEEQREMNVVLISDK